MSLSIHKLLQILDKCNLYASKYYGKDNICVYINMISKLNGNEYMLYIPSKYNISLKGIKNNVYEIKGIDISKKNKDLLSEYGDYNQDVSSEMGENLITENSLINNYKNDKMEDIKDIKCLNRHMKRLKYILKSSEYKVVIENDNILGCINRGNDIFFYRIKNYDNKDNNTNKCLICVDLELFYKKFENINRDLSNVKNKIYSVLDRNYDKNINYINNLLINTDINTTKLNNHIMSKKKIYYSNIQKLNELLVLLSLLS